MMPHKHHWPGCQEDSFKMAAAKVNYIFKTNFFRMVGTSEEETSVSDKAECLNAIAKDEEASFLE